MMILLRQSRTCIGASSVPSEVTYIERIEKLLKNLQDKSNVKKYDEERIRQLGERTAAKIIIDQGLGNEKKSMAIKQNVANEIKKDMSLVKALKFRKERDICIQDYKRRIMQRREYYDIRKQKAARCHVSGYGRVNTASNYGYRIAGTGFFMLYTRSLYTGKKNEIRIFVETEKGHRLPRCISSNICFLCR